MTIVVIVICVIIATIGLLFIFYQNSHLHKNKNRIQNALLALQQEIQSNDDVLENCEAVLECAAREFLTAQQNQRLKSIPIESIKDVGASNVRIPLLHNAGYHTLADLVGVREKSFTQIRGIGQTSAKKIVTATNELLSRVHSLPPTLPKPDLSEEHSKKLAESAIKLVEAREMLVEGNNWMKEMIAPLIEEARKHNSDHDFMAWLFSFGNSRIDLYANSDELVKSQFSINI